MLALKKPEETIRLYLEEDEDTIRLVAEKENGDTNRILIFGKQSHAIYKIRGIKEDYGFKLDGDGELMISD